MEQKEREPSQSDMTMAGVQAFLGIIILAGIAVPAAIIYYVILPMGWGAIWPLTLIAFGGLCLARILWVVMRKK